MRHSCIGETVNVHGDADRVLSLAESDPRSDSPSNGQIELYRTLISAVDALLSLNCKSIFEGERA